MADMADAPGGGSLAFTAPSLQLSMRFSGNTDQSMPFRARELGIRRGRGVDRQGVDVGLQQIVDRGVYQPVTRHGRYAAERLGHYGYAEMTVAARGPRLTGVQGTPVLDGHQPRHKPPL